MVGSNAVEIKGFNQKINILYYDIWLTYNFVQNYNITRYLKPSNIDYSIDYY